MKSKLIQDTKLEFNSLRFNEKQDHITLTFMKIFQAKIKKQDLNHISDFSIEDNAIIFKNINYPRAEKKFNFLLYKAFNNLTNTLTKKPTVYIHQNSGIPLLGTVYYGFIDRDTNVIEVRTITGCNIDCIFCSVDEYQRNRDFIVEKDYLVQEFKKHIENKESNNIEVHINPQAEPFLYADLIPMIKDLSKLKKVKTISINTNATFLSKTVIDNLKQAGLTRINISLCSLNKKTAQIMAGAKINIESIKENLIYASKTMDINIAPVLMKGYNEKEMPEIIEFAKSLQKNTKYKIRIGIQNFLLYKHGKKSETIDWNDFYKYLKDLEKQHKVNLTPDFGIENVKPIEKPFKKGDVIKAEIVCDGRFPNEKIAIAKNRSIVVKNCNQEGITNIKIIRAKDNIFTGIPL